MTKLIIATQNQGKVKEIKELLKNLPIEVVLPENEEDVEETGTTFEENALLKANAYHERYPNDLILADDSGLEVDALDGRPGVYSKRYGTSDEHRNQKLLGELEKIADKKRTARFISVMALVGPNLEELFKGTVEGFIAHSVKGSEGFGYDPVFVPTGYTESFAQLGQDVKNILSHRARALDQVKKFLEKK